MQPNDSVSSQDTFDNDEIDLFELMKTIAEGKWLILAITVLCFSAATGLAFWMTPKYEAKVVASFAEEGKSGGLSALAGQFGGLAEMAGISVGGGGGNKENYMAYIKSRLFLETYIKDNELMPILFAKQWDSANKKWLTEDPEKLPTPYKAYEFFTKKVMDIQADKKTGLVTLTITWKDRDLATTWANDLIKQANAKLREKAITETQLSLSYLEKELQKTSVSEVQNTIYKVMESQIKNMMMANTQEQYAFKVIDPAAAVDENAFVQPKRPMMMALGAVIGLFAGIVAVFVRKAIHSRKQAQNRAS